jgi:hypothetical protein
MTDIVADSMVATPKLARESVRAALDDLFQNARQFNSSKAYLKLMQFIGQFRFYSPFNATLIHIQMPGARFVATAHRWRKEYCREIKPGARPLVILQPMGPVLFVFDVAHTDPLPGAPPLPRSVERPFEVRQGTINAELEQTIENAKRDGIRIDERPQGSQRAGSIQCAFTPGYLDVLVSAGAMRKYKYVQLQYQLLLNSNLSREARYATLVHELGHLYCGHLGTPYEKWWPDRQGLSLSVREFEAESICYLVCARLGIDNPSEEYLAAYMRRYESTPPISLDCVMKSSWLIEQMGRERLPMRKNAVFALKLDAD